MVHDFPRHAHQSHLLVLITDGAREMDLSQQTIQIRAGQGFFLPAGTSHACRSIVQHDYYAIAVPEAFWAELADENTLPAFTFFDHGAAGLSALRELLRVLRFDADPMAIETALLAVLTSVQSGEQPVCDEAHVHMVESVRSWLCSHFTEPVRLQDLVKLTGWQPGTINKLFRMHAGIPPYEFLLHQRLREVAHLLRASGMQLSDIAVETGFADQSHMQRLFRRAYGVTPKAYRTAGAASERFRPEGG